MNLFLRRDHGAHSNGLVRQERFSYLLFILLALALTPMVAKAGKVDDVRKTVKEACNLDIKEEDLMDAVVKVYDCNPNSKVKLGDCAVKCMKTTGAIVGGGK